MNLNQAKYLFLLGVWLCKIMQYLDEYEMYNTALLKPMKSWYFRRNPLHETYHISKAAKFVEGFTDNNDETSHLWQLVHTTQSPQPNDPPFFQTAMFLDRTFLQKEIKIVTVGFNAVFVGPCAVQPLHSNLFVKSVN